MSVVDKNKTSSQTTQTLLEKDSFFIKITWYLLCVFMVFIFIKQLKTEKESTKKIKDKESFFVKFYDGRFQEKYESNLLSRPFILGLKTLKHNFEYQYLHKINVDDSYEGKDGYIFGIEMTKANYGDDFIGEPAIKKQVEKAKFVQEKLKELNIGMLLIFAPGKGTIYPEYLPEFVTKTKKKTTNREIYIKESIKAKLNLINFIDYFKILKDTLPYPLFSKYGSHWSYYSECIVIDTTIRKLEQIMNIDLPNLEYDDIQVMDTSLVRDGDVLMKINIPIPKGHKLAYPNKITYRRVDDKLPPKILAIGDSYFKGFFYLLAMKNSFNDSKQWYYYNSIIPENPENLEVWELDLKQEILKTRAIVILCNEANLKSLGNGFIDDAYELFKNPKKYYADKKVKDELNKYKKNIRQNTEVLFKLTKESQNKRIPLDSLITLEALKKIKKHK